MVLKSSLVFEPDTSIEVFFDNIIEVGTTHNREILTYDLSDAPEIEEFARNRHPSNTAYQGSIQTDIIEKKRKLVYLNSYADNVIVIDGGNENAIYGNINPLDISDRNTVVADLSFTAIAKGGITGQYIPVTDTTYTGTLEYDILAADADAVLFNSASENLLYEITQSSIILPEGSYKFFARVRGGTVTDDLFMSVYYVTVGSICLFLDFLNFS